MIKSITSVKVSGRLVILRAGFDVPLVEKNNEWEVADDSRIRDILSTLKYLINEGAKIVIISHLDRPEGWDKNKSLWPVAKRLAEILGYRISDKLPDHSAGHICFLSQDITKQDYSGLSRQLQPHDILFLENLRFYPGEEGNDEKFVDLLACYGEVFVNEAFSVAHRKESSTFGLAKKLPAYAGISFLKEIKALERLVKHPQQPFVVIMGGAKIHDKIGTIENLAKHASAILIGGELANTFLSALGYEIGKSKSSDVAVARSVLRDYKHKIILPIDLVVAKSPESPARKTKLEGVSADEMIMDIGPETIRKFSIYIKQAKTLVWNGPVGLIEHRKFAFGSRALAQVFAARSKGRAFGVVGGGETSEVIDQAKVAQFIDHVSMGGGAMLEFLAGKQLPAIKALEKRT